MLRLLGQMRVPARCCLHQIGQILDWLGEHDRRTAAMLKVTQPWLS
jgi:hypothetical protein